MTANLILMFVLLLSSLSLPSSVLAIGLSNEEYTIQSEDTLQPVVVANADDSTSNAFLHYESSFVLDSDQISFDPLIPTNPLERRQSLRITNSRSLATGVSVQQDTAFHDDKNNQIPSTSCDNGSCTVQKSDIWTNTLTYGFGFRCERSFFCRNLFPEKSMFSPLPMMHQSLSYALRHYLMSNDVVNFYYKVNVAGSQPPGTYRTRLRYTVLPNM